MEIALHDAYSKLGTDERPKYRLIHEYPLEGKPPMMTHVFEDTDGNRVISAKGAPEALIEVSNLAPHEIQLIEENIKALATEGYSVLGVGEALFNRNDFPAEQQLFKFTFKGLVVFYDPPKKNIHTVPECFYNAGITVKIITGSKGKS
jgi:Ca2+-transporting ATPase